MFKSKVKILVGAVEAYHWSFPMLWPSAAEGARLWTQWQGRYAGPSRGGKRGKFSRAPRRLGGPAIAQKYWKRCSRWLLSDL